MSAFNIIYKVKELVEYSKVNKKKGSRYFLQFINDKVKHF